MPRSGNPETAAVPRRGDLKESLLIILAMFGFGEEPKSHKFLAEQRLAYARHRHPLWLAELGDTPGNSVTETPIGQAEGSPEPATPPAGGMADSREDGVAAEAAEAAGSQEGR